MCKLERKSLKESWKETKDKFLTTFEVCTIKE